MAKRTLHTTLYPPTPMLTDDPVCKAGSIERCHLQTDLHHHPTRDCFQRYLAACQGLPAAPQQHQHSSYLYSRSWHGYPLVLMPGMVSPGPAPAFFITTVFITLTTFGITYFTSMMLAPMSPLLWQLNRSG